MIFGNQTVSFVTLTQTGAPDSLGMKTMVPTEVPVKGCRHRPLSAAETPEYLTNIATQVWKTTAPPVAAAIAARSTDDLKVGGVVYQIVGGAKPFTDQTGRVFKVTILSKIQGG